MRRSGSHPRLSHAALSSARSPASAHSPVDPDGSAGDESEEVDREALKSELSHRLVAAMRASYLHRFETGLVTRGAVAILVDAAESALDESNGKELETQWDLIMPFFTIPRWMETVHGHVQWLGDSLLYDRLAFAVELAAGFLEATEAIDAIERVFPEFAEFNVVDDLKRECVQYRQRASDAWRSILEAYPEVYQAIQTKHAAQHVFVSEKASIDRMFRMGVLEEREMMKMNALVDERIYTLDRMRPAHVRQAKKSDLLEELPFFATLARRERADLLHAPVRIFNPGDALYRHGEYSDGVYIITRGFVENNGRTRSVHDLIGLWSFLTGKPNAGDRVATTYVQTVWVEAALLGRMLDREATSRSLWKLAASELVQAAFLEELSELWQGRSTMHALQQVEWGELLVARAGQEVAVRTAALLLTGQCHCRVADARMLAPCLVMGQEKVRLAGGSRLLVFASDAFASSGHGGDRHAHRRQGTAESALPSPTSTPGPADDSGAESKIEADKRREHSLMQHITRSSGVGQLTRGASYRVRQVNRNLKGRSSSGLHARSGMSGARASQSDASRLRVLEATDTPDAGAGPSPERRASPGPQINSVRQGRRDSRSQRRSKSLKGRRANG